MGCAQAIDAIRNYCYTSPLEHDEIRSQIWYTYRVKAITGRGDNGLVYYSILTRTGSVTFNRVMQGDVDGSLVIVKSSFLTNECVKHIFHFNLIKSLLKNYSTQHLEHTLLNKLLVYLNEIIFNNT